MIEESAKVLSIKENWLLLQAQPSNACGSCHARSACGQGLLSRYFNQTPGQISIENRLPTGQSLSLKEGDEVIIGINESTVLKGAFFAYMLPLLFVVLFALLTQLAGIKTEWQQLLVIVSGLFLGLAVVRFMLNGKQRHLHNMLPVLLRKAVQAEKISIKEIC
jgi:sigma-E factor negative regulatory protein RseC